MRFRPLSALPKDDSQMIVTSSDHGLYGFHPVRQDAFAELMDLYERNYIGIRRLIPAMPPASIRLVSQVPEGLSLHLEIIERFRYTTELSLTYYFMRADGRSAEPDLRIRVYHDARLAEVMAAHLRRWPAFQLDDERGADSQLRSRWRVNRFLYKWLNYCFHQGHCFRTKLS